MKRLIVRLSILAGVIVLGLITIAQAQRIFRDKEANAAKEPGKLATHEPAEIKPIPLTTESEEPVAGDPFAARAAGSAAKAQTTKTTSLLPAGSSSAMLKKGASRFAANLPAEDDAAESDAPPKSLMMMVTPRGIVNGEEEEERLGIAAPDEGPSFVEQTAADESAAAAVPAKQAGGQPTPAKAAPPRRFPVDVAAAEADRYGRRVAAEPLDPQPTVADTGETETAAEEADAFAPPRRAVGAAQAPAAAAPLAAGNQGTGRPGAQTLEGPQTPNLVIEKTAPKEIQVGKPATFTIKVRNAGTGAAHGVEIHDEVPEGTQLAGTTPPARQDPNGTLVWDLGTVKPNQEVTAQVQLVPLAEGEIGSLATVHFRAEASVRTIATKPQLTIQVESPTKVMIGDDVMLKIKISNPGTGIATGIVLKEEVPQGLKHPAGNELELEIGDLKPGEKRELDLTLTATAPGRVTNVLVARGEANLIAEERAELEVIAPALKVGLTGPKRRYLERSATYNISVSNPGTASAKDIELVTVLPKGLKFVSANNAGQYDSATHSVYWSLEELPAQETGSVTLTALPIEAGELKLQIKGQAKQGLADQQEETISVEGLAAIQFSLTDVNDPVEVNGETTYEIRVTNQGSKAASNVRLVAILPPEMKPLSGEGPVKYTIDGQRVLFDPLQTLAPKADTTYSVKVQGLEPGDLRIKVQVVTDEIRTPVTKEESTRVYADE